MGRGQQTATRGWVADHFSHIFGNRRGSNRVDEPPYVSSSLCIGAYVLQVFQPGTGDALALDGPPRACVSMYRRGQSLALARNDLSTVRKMVSLQLRQGASPCTLAGHRISREEMESVRGWLGQQREAHPD